MQSLGCCAMVCAVGALWGRAALCKAGLSSTEPIQTLQLQGKNLTAGSSIPCPESRGEDQLAGHGWGWGSSQDGLGDGATP